MTTKSNNLRPKRVNETTCCDCGKSIKGSEIFPNRYSYWNWVCQECSDLQWEDEENDH